MIAAKLIRLGLGVFTPAYGHDDPFDMIAHWNGFLSRIQVKAARDGDGGSILINGQGVVDRAGGNSSRAAWINLMTSPPEQSRMSSTICSGGVISP
jgi:hypothetical protein